MSCSKEKKLVGEWNEWQIKTCNEDDAETCMRFSFALDLLEARSSRKMLVVHAAGNSESLNKVMHVKLFRGSVSL